MRAPYSQVPSALGRASLVAGIRLPALLTLPRTNEAERGEKSDRATALDAGFNQLSLSLTLPLYISISLYLFLSRSLFAALVFRCAPSCERRGMAGREEVREAFGSITFLKGARNEASAPLIFVYSGPAGPDSLSVKD